MTQETQVNTSKVGNLFNLMTSGVKNPATWLMQQFGLASNSSSGIPVTYESVIGIPEVWGAISKISGHLAQMPIELRVRPSIEARTSEVDWKDPGGKVLRSPSEFFTSFQIVEKLMLDALIWGNGRLYIERNRQGQPIALYPIQAEDTTTVVTDGNRFHAISINTGSAVGPLSEVKNYTIPDEDIFYVMGLSRNGWWGENPVNILRDTYGLAIAGSEASGSTFRNAGRPGLMLEAPRGAFRSEKERKEFMDTFNEAHQGLDNAGKTGLIHSGMKAHMMPNDTNTTGYVQQRQFQRESVAMTFLLESVFGDNTGSTYKSVTERNSAYLTNCLGRWIGKIEAEADKKLRSQNMKRAEVTGFKVDTSVLYKHDKQYLAQYTTSLRQQAIISGNEAREMHGFPPAEGLDDDYDALLGGGGSLEEDDGDRVIPEQEDDTEVEEPDDDQSSPNQDTE